MRDYFKTLNNLDPLLNSIVINKLKEIQKRLGLNRISIDELNEHDELEVLREYCLSLYREYRVLRTMFLENMDISSISSEGLKSRLN